MSSSGWNKLQLERVRVEGAEEMIALGARWASRFVKGDILTLHGGLGAGKTTFMKGLASGLGAAAVEAVASPTFTYLHIYEQGTVSVYHFDLYRLQGPEDFLSLGFDDFLERDGICCIEWPERMDSLLLSSHYQLDFAYSEPMGRELTLWHKQKRS